MLLYFAVFVAGLSAFLLLRKHPEFEEFKIYILILMLAGGLGGALELSTGDGGVLTKDESGRSGIYREEPGGKDHEELLHLSVDGIYDGEYEVEVKARGYTAEELDLVFDQAAGEAEERFLGENESLEHISGRVSLPEYVVNGTVRAVYTFNPSNIVSSAGEIKDENVTDEGTVLETDVTFKYQGSEAVHTFYAMVFPRELSAEDKALKGLSGVIDEENEKNSDFLALPEEIDGRRVRWSEQKKETDYSILIFGCIAAGALFFARKKEAERQKKLRDEELAFGYPAMVSTLSLLLGSGMTVFGAWERIVRMYLKKKERGGEESAVYEEMLFTYRHISDGMGEKAAYEEFGVRVGLGSYRKLVSLIVQSLRKGNAGLCEKLEKETEAAYEQQRNLTKVKGEEAQTKTLLPMVLYLLVVIVVIVVPAMTGMKI